MNALLFDTLRLSRTLRDKGHFTPEQAETLAEALGEAQHGDLATKADLAVLKSDIVGVKSGIGSVETKLGSDIAETEARLKLEIAEVKTKIAIVETRIGDLATKAELSDMRADILRWIVGAIGFQTVVMVGALITLVRIFVK